MTATELRAGERTARPQGDVAKKGKRLEMARFGSVGIWLFGAFACAGLAIVGVAGAWVPGLGSTSGFYSFATIAIGLALLCALLAGVRAVAELIEATKAVKVTQEKKASPARSDVDGDATFSMESLEAQLSGSLITEFAGNEISQHSERLAAALEMASRAIGAHNEAMRAHLQDAVDATSASMNVHTKTFTERLGEERNKVAEALDLYGESIASRLNLASVALAREFRDSAEQLRKGMEASSDAAATALSRRGEAIAQTLKASADEIERGLAERSREMVTAVEATSRASSQALTLESDAASQRFANDAQTLADRVATALRVHIDEAGESRRSLLAALDDGGGAFAQQVSTASSAIGKGLADAEEIITRVVDGALRQMESKIDARVAEFGSRLTSVEQEIDQRWATRRGELAAEIAAEAEALKIAVVEGASEASRAAGQELVAVKDAFLSGAQAATRDFATEAKSSAEVLNSAAQEFASAAAAHNSAFADRAAAIESTLDGRGAALIEKLEGQSSALRAALENVEGIFSDREGGVVGAIDRAARDLSTAVAEHASDFGAKAGTVREALDGAIQAHGESWTARAEAERMQLAELADRHGASVTQALTAHRESTERAFAAAAADFLAQAAERENAAAVQLRTTAQSVVDELLGRMGDITEVLGSRGETLRAQFAARQAELVEVIGVGLAQTEERAGERLSAISGALEALAQRIDSGLESRGKAIAQTLARATLDITQGLAVSSQELKTAIDTGAAGAVNVLAGQGLATRSTLENGAREAARILETGREQFVSALAATAKEAVDSLAARGRETRDALAADTVEAVAQLEASRSAVGGAATNAVQTLAQEFERHHAELSKTVESGVERLNRDFGSPLNDTIARIEAEGAELAAATRSLAESIAKTAAIHRDSMKQGFDRDAEALAATLSGNAETFRRDFQAALAGADQAFLGRSLEIASALANRIGELRVLLETDGRAFVEGFESRGEAFASHVETASQRSLAEFERKATDLIKLLTRRGDDLLSSMTAAASESARKVAVLNGDLDAGVERTDVSLRNMERKFTTLLAMIDKRGDDLTAMMGHRAAPRAEDAAPAEEAPPAPAPESDEDRVLRSA